MRKRGQIWVETVLYTLIGLTLIGIVLALVMPKINESRDRALVEQSIASMNTLDEELKEVLDKGQGNIRRIDSFSLKKGEIEVDTLGEKITLILDDLAKPYSEPGVEIRFGNLKIISESGQKESSVRIEAQYNGVANITYFGAEELKKFSASSTPYSFTFENQGTSGGLTMIDIREVSRS